ncbi:MAG TPA: hypothetical protein VKB83_03350 [Nitrosopumilaceae archaeon]|nr:hypothetical protein [Nitrosopumilaceae archaeon]
MKPIYLVIALFPLIISVTPNALGTFDDITLTAPKMVNTTGQELTSFQVGQQIGIESTLTNHATSEQKFTYLVQVMNKDGAAQYLEGFSASMVSNQSFTASQVWIPKEPGQYTIQVYIWDSLTSGIPLTHVLQTQIAVNP